MRQRFLTLLLSAIMLQSIFDKSYAVERAQPQKTYPPFAVVELYTSEGCSSCPPADILLGQLTKRAKAEKIRLYTLSFHVDYWNHLGWRDPFSKREFSSRQRKYAELNRSQNVYTPQMIVNGRFAFGGFRYDLAEDAIEQSLKLPAKIDVRLEEESSTDRSISVRYTVSDTPQGGLLNIALVEGDIAIDIKRGENAGRVLKHDNVVHDFKTISLRRTSGIVKFNFPAEMNRKKSTIIAYVQDRHTLLMNGATSLGL